MQNAIVTAADSKYLPAACCALLSCVGDGEAHGQAKMFILAFDASAADISKANTFLGSHGASAEIIAINADRFRQFRIDGHVSASTYSRLLLPEFFDSRWNRLLYVDADMRVMTPLRPLLEADLGNHAVGAVHDYLRYLIYGIKATRTRLELKPDAPYFNAGLMCFDWRATLASGFLQQAKAFAIENSALCESHDQDALNKALEGAWTPLDPRWNFMIVAVPDKIFRLSYPDRFRPYISHFAGPLKPWTADFSSRYDSHRAWYRDLLRDSPWPHFAAPRDETADKASVLSLAGRLTDWLVSRRRQLRRTVKALLRSQNAAERLPSSIIAQKVSSKGFRKDAGANAELAHLIDQMISEAADSNTAVKR